MRDWTRNGRKPAEERQLKWWPGVELNHRHRDFQKHALSRSMDPKSKNANRILN